MVLYFFFFFLTKKEENTQIRLTDYIRKVNRDIAEEESRYDQEFTSKCYFDNDLENYPISEGDLINISTEKDYSKYVYVHPVDHSQRREVDVRIFVFSPF